MLHVKPAPVPPALAEQLGQACPPHLMVRDPVRRDLLPAYGRAVAESGYWTRRLRDGDVVETDAASIAAGEAADAAALTIPDKPAAAEETDR